MWSIGRLSVGFGTISDSLRHFRDNMLSPSHQIALEQTPIPYLNSVNKLFWHVNQAKALYLTLISENVSKAWQKSEISDHFVQIECFNLFGPWKSMVKAYVWTNRTDILLKDRNWKFNLKIFETIRLVIAIFFYFEPLSFCTVQNTKLSTQKCELWSHNLIRKRKKSTGICTLR